MLQLTEEQQALLALLGNAYKIPENVAWDLVKKEAQQQAVFLIAGKSETLPTEIYDLWKTDIYKFLMLNTQSYYAVKETDRIMKSIGCKYVILKGVAAASYYNSDIFYRAFGDVDFLIESDKRETVEKALEDEGYKNWKTDHVCHVVFRKDRQHLEMHFEISGIPDGKPGESVREYLRTVFRETDTINLQGVNIHIPLPQYHGLILLLHMQHHMLAEGLGLRHLMDWSMFVDKMVDESFWDESLIPVLKRIGLFRYSQVMTKTGSLYFGTACPKWCEETEEDLCDAVMNDILIGGNFGRKNEERSASGKMISLHGKQGTKHGKVYYLWKQLQDAARVNFPFVKRVPFLYPFFYPYITIRYLFRIVTGERYSLITVAKYADERKNVYDRLHVFEVK